MRVYIDSDYKCHVNYAEMYTPVECPHFDGKCADYIEGFYFVPDGCIMIWDKEIIKGEVLFPWKPYSELEKAQAAYEHEQLVIDRDKCLADMQELIDEVLGG